MWGSLLTFTLTLAWPYLRRQNARQHRLHRRYYLSPSRSDAAVGGGDRVVEIGHWRGARGCHRWSRSLRLLPGSELSRRGEPRSRRTVTDGQISRPRRPHRTAATPFSPR
ncbi:unnamed protein product, partial [Ectocarpus sp. 12 AP-2014]